MSRKTWTFWFFLTLMNISDTLGKWLAGRPYGMISDRIGYILTYSRLIFLVTANLIKFEVGPVWLVGPSADWFKILHMAIFGFTNGYCLTLMAIKSPSKAPPHKKDDVGIFVGVFIIIGLVLGTLIAIPADVKKKTMMMI